MYIYNMCVIYTNIYIQNSSWFYFPSLLLKETSVRKCKVSQLSPNFEVKYEQKSKIKDKFFGHFNLKLKGTCTASKYKLKMNNKDSSGLGQQ